MSPIKTADLQEMRRGAPVRGEGPRVARTRSIKTFAPPLPLLLPSTGTLEVASPPRAPSASASLVAWEDDCPLPWLAADTGERGERMANKHTSEKLSTRLEQKRAAQPYVHTLDKFGE